MNQDDKEKLVWQVRDIMSFEHTNRTLSEALREVYEGRALVVSFEKLKAIAERLLAKRDS